MSSTCVIISRYVLVYRDATNILRAPSDRSFIFCPHILTMIFSFLYSFGFIMPLILPVSAPLRNSIYKICLTT